jgi:hypothetical protein
VAWTSFLEAPSSGEHAVQIYGDLAEIAESVASFLDAGFRAGAPALLVATSDHAETFETHLERAGWQCEELRRQGLLVVLDAGDTLAAVMEGGSPSAERFRAVVGGALDDLAAPHPETTIRAFGEMVDLLWQRGRERAAIALEELWNDLARERPFALLCGYQLDLFDAEVQAGALPEIFRTHSCQRPTADPPRLAAAVDKALVETVGPHKAGNIYLQIAETVPRSGLPRAQAVLSWLSRTDSTVAQQVLSRARALYATA